MTVCFGDIGGIDDHHCLNFLFRDDFCFVDIGGIDDHHCLIFLIIRYGKKRLSCISTNKRTSANKNRS